MVIHIPSDMIPRMDWNTEDKQAAWAFYRRGWSSISSLLAPPHEAKVTHILFYGARRL